MIRAAELQARLLESMDGCTPRAFHDLSRAPKGRHQALGYSFDPIQKCWDV
jgi:hypothetical protein